MISMLIKVTKSWMPTEEWFDCLKASRKMCAKGISLLEIMIVLAVIALIMGLVAPRVIGYFGRAKTQTAEIQMTHIKGALQLMYIDMGRYPSEAEGLGALITAPAGSTGWQGPYLEDAEGLKDPWNRQYLYRFPGGRKIQIKKLTL